VFRIQGADPYWESGSGRAKIGLKKWKNLVSCLKSSLEIRIQQNVWIRIRNTCQIFRIFYRTYCLWILLFLDTGDKKENFRFKLFVCLQSLQQDPDQRWFAECWIQVCIDLVDPNLTVNIVCEYRYQRFCAVVWFGATRPLPRKRVWESYSIQYIHGVETRKKDGVGNHFSPGTQIIRHDRKSGTLYTIRYSLYEYGSYPFFWFRTLGYQHIHVSFQLGKRKCYLLVLGLRFQNTSKQWKRHPKRMSVC